jgi:hypothetical protein
MTKYWFEDNRDAIKYNLGDGKTGIYFYLVIDIIMIPMLF